MFNYSQKPKQLIKQKLLNQPCMYFVHLIILHCSAKLNFLAVFIKNKCNCTTLVILTGRFSPQIKTSEPNHPRLWEGLRLKQAQSSKAIYEHKTHRQWKNHLSETDLQECSNLGFGQLEALSSTYCSLIPN